VLEVSKIPRAASRGREISGLPISFMERAYTMHRCRVHYPPMQAWRRSGASEMRVGAAGA